MQVTAVISARARIKDQIGELAEVAVAVGGDPGLNTGGDFGAGGAGETSEVEVCPLVFGKVDFGGESGELVKAGFVIGVAREVRLRGG